MPAVSAESATLYEHCVRVLEHGDRVGPHGLPLMGTGDWNDGMNKVGAGGQGESVWNGWFILTVLKAFAELADRRGDAERAAWCRERAEGLRVALEAHAWDGRWYRRAYFDDGTPLGSATNDECQIDALPQEQYVLPLLLGFSTYCSPLLGFDGRLDRDALGPQAVVFAVDIVDDEHHQQPLARVARDAGGLERGEAGTQVDHVHARVGPLHVDESVGGHLLGEAEVIDQELGGGLRVGDVEREGGSGDLHGFSSMTMNSVRCTSLLWEIPRELAI